MPKRLGTTCKITDDWMFEGIKAKIIINELLFLFFLLLFLSINFHYFVPMDTNILLSCGGKTVIGPRIAASCGCKPTPQKTKTLIQLYPNFSMSEIHVACPVLRPVLRLLKTTQSATS